MTLEFQFYFRQNTSFNIETLEKPNQVYLSPFLLKSADFDQISQLACWRDIRINITSNSSVINWVNSLDCTVIKYRAVDNFHVPRIFTSGTMWYLNWNNRCIRQLHDL